MDSGSDISSRASEAMLKAEFLCKSIPEGLVAGYLNVNTPVYFINDCMLEYLGYKDQAEFEVATKGVCRNFVHPQDWERVVKEIGEQYHRGDKVYKAAYRVVKKDGTYTWMMSKSVVFHQADGEPIMLSSYVDITEKQDLMDRVNRAELMLRAAIGHANIGVWEYDLKEKTLSRIYSLPRFSILPEVIKRVPEDIIESGLIHKESIPDFRKLFERIDNGESSASAEVKLYFEAEDVFVWERAILSVIHGEDGRPVNGIFISEDITAEKEAEFKYQHELQLRNTVALDCIGAGRINLSANKVEFVQIDSRWGEQLDCSEMTYTNMMELEAPFITNKEDAERYNTTFDRKKLLNDFAEGRTNIGLDYRRELGDGRIAWVNLGVNLVKDAVTGDIYSYGALRDISEQKTIELSLRQRAEMDALTGAYNRDTARDMISEASAAADKEGREYVISLYSIDNFSDIIHKNGYAAGDDVIKEMYSVLNTELDDPKIIGRLFGDEMIVWMSTSQNANEVLKRAENIRQDLNNSSLIAKLGMNISVSVGIAFSEMYGRDPKMLAHKAQEALLVCKEIGGNCCIIRDEQLNSYDEKQKQKNVYLQHDVGAIIMRCAFSLTNTSDFGKAIKNVLRDLNDYYGSECACLIEMDGSIKGEMRNVYTHGDSGVKCGAENANEFLRRIKSVLGDKKRVFIDSVDADRQLKAELFERLGIHGTYCVALEINGNINGYLSLSNPSLHNGDDTLIDMLSCILANDIDKRQLKERQEYLNTYDEFTGLLNRNSYLRFVARYSADSAISLGVAVADINGLKQINAQYGRSSGDSLVQFAAQVLKLVPGGKAFRLAGDEFILICENFTQEAFHKQMESLRDNIDNEHPESIAIGYAWTDTDINPEFLVMQADEKMMISKQTYYKDGIRILKRRDPKAERVLVDDIRQGRYEVYLQPKAVVTDSSISGAEALIRYRNIAGELIPPVNFIPQLEQTGNIYHIDIFVFEEVCRTLKRWQEEGRRMIPISLNFSRVTLLRESLISDMEEIYQRYQVPKQLIEIEVAESMGSVERQTLIDISADIVKNGYILSLDDFGAKYSNLSILSVLDLHVLKLDKSLVNDLLSNNNTRKVLRNFLKTCNDLDIVSVAEGVETKEQLEILKELGCDYAQGYYFNKPIPLADFEKLYL